MPLSSAHAKAAAWGRRQAALVLEVKPTLQTQVLKQ